MLFLKVSFQCNARVPVMLHLDYYPFLFSELDIETNINFGFCQNTLFQPIQPFTAAGWVVPVRGNLIHFETYFQPAGNSSIQIGIDVSKSDYQTLFMIGYGFSGPAFLSVVRAL